MYKKPLNKSPRRSIPPLNHPKLTSYSKKQTGTQCEITKIKIEAFDKEKFFTAEMRETYIRALSFINNCHMHMNSLLEQKLVCGDNANMDIFKLPEMQNYIPLYEILMDKFNTQVIYTEQQKENSVREENCLKKVVEKLSNTSIIEFVPEIKKLKEYKELERKLSLNGLRPDSGFDSKNSSEEITCKPSVLEIADEKVLDPKPTPEMPSPILDDPCKSLDLTAADNRAFIGEIIKEQLDALLMKQNQKAKCSQTNLNQVNAISKPVKHYKSALKQTESGNRKSGSCIIQRSVVQNPLDHFKRSLMDDDNSIILDDEEFERLSLASSMHQKMSQQKSEQLCKNVPNHPFKLNKRDMPMINKAVLSAIGIFTEKGEIRPDMVEMMEKEKKQNSNNSKNKKFREKRRYDVQILKPEPNFYSASSPSAHSLKSDSSDIKSDSELEMLENERSRKAVK